MSAIHLYAPTGYTFRRVMACPVCERRRRFVVTAFVWHGPHLQCCGCGDSFNDDGRVQRPFKRGWRGGAVRRARALWAASKAYDPAAIQALLEPVATFDASAGGAS